MVEKQEPTNRDQYTKMGVLRLVKNEAGKTLSFKKFIYLSSVVSYEDGTSTGDFEWDGDVIYVICVDECFYMSGKVDDFDKEINKYISSIRKLNSSE